MPAPSAATPVMAINGIGLAVRGSGRLEVELSDDDCEFIVLDDVEL
jgi:hypothetical protein